MKILGNKKMKKFRVDTKSPYKEITEFAEKESSTLEFKQELPKNCTWLAPKHITPIYQGDPNHAGLNECCFESPSTLFRA
jgi:hypothetical protein